MSDGYQYPYFPQTFQPVEAPQQAPPPPHVSFPQPVQKAVEYVPPDLKLKCDLCKEEIYPGDDCINFFVGKAGRGSKSGRIMVKESEDYPNADCSIHFECLPYFLFENLPETADELRSIELEMREPEDVFCQACGDRLDPDNDED